jgi:hypothetical protein
LPISHTQTSPSQQQKANGPEKIGQGLEKTAELIRFLPSLRP